MLVHLGGKGVEGMSKKNIKPFHFLEFSQFELFVKMDPCSLTIEAIAKKCLNMSKMKGGNGKIYFLSLPFCCPRKKANLNQNRYRRRINEALIF